MGNVSSHKYSLMHHCNVLAKKSFMDTGLLAGVHTQSNNDYFSNNISNHEYFMFAKISCPMVSVSHNLDVIRIIRSLDQRMIGEWCVSVIAKPENGLVISLYQYRKHIQSTRY